MSDFHVCIDLLTTIEEQSDYHQSNTCQTPLCVGASGERCSDCAAGQTACCSEATATLDVGGQVNRDLSL